MIELTDKAFRGAILDALQTGKELEKERIVNALNNDAVITTSVSTQWLEYIVRIVENV